MSIDQGKLGDSNGPSSDPTKGSKFWADFDVL